VHQIAQPKPPEHAGIDQPDGGAADAQIVDDLWDDETEVEAAEVEKHVEAGEHQQDALFPLSVALFRA
jgi:hypothetical protein